MEAYSLKDDGAGIKFCVFCYNVQPGIGIDYSNGDSWLNQISTAEAIQEESDRESSQDNNTQTYILNTNTKKVHYPSCPSVEQMKYKNKQEYTGTRGEVISIGYESCKNCRRPKWQNGIQVITKQLYFGICSLIPTIRGRALSFQAILPDYYDIVFCI